MAKGFGTAIPFHFQVQNINGAFHRLMENNNL